MQYLIKDFGISRSPVKYGKFSTGNTENITFLDHYLLTSVFYIIYYYIFFWFSYFIKLNFNWLNLFKRLLRLCIKVVWVRKMGFSLAGRLRASGKDLYGWWESETTLAKQRNQAKVIRNLHLKLKILLE